MKNLKHWMVCLDLSKMDNILLAYTQFLTSLKMPKTISFLHVIESGAVVKEMNQVFPDLKSEEEIKEVVLQKITAKVTEYFQNSAVEIEIFIKEGKPTNQIIKTTESLDPDLLIIGKKNSFIGEGLIARQIVNYLRPSILFIPETSRHAIDAILVPVDFSENSANAIKEATDLIGEESRKVLAQHVFKYPIHFFPYMLKDEEKEQLDDHLLQKKNNFISQYKIPSKVRFILSILKEGKKADEIYEEVVSNQVDLIIAGYKSKKKFSVLLHENFIDKLIYYPFGVPLLVLKIKDG